MPNITMIEKLTNILVRKYTFLLINHFATWQDYFIDEDFSRMELLASEE